MEREKADNRIEGSQESCRELFKLFKEWEEANNHGNGQRRECTFK